MNYCNKAIPLCYLDRFKKNVFFLYAHSYNIVHCGFTVAFTDTIVCISEVSIIFCCCCRTHLGQPFSELCVEVPCHDNVPLFILKCTSVAIEKDNVLGMISLSFKHETSIDSFVHEIDSKGTLDDVDVDLLHAYVFLRKFVQNIPNHFIDWEMVRRRDDYSFSKCRIIT